jgi:hypothetical protein
LERLFSSRFADVPQCGAEDAPPVDAVVLEEAAVLDRQERLAHLLGHTVQRNIDPAHVLQTAERHAAPVEHPATLGWPEVLDRRRGGTPGKAARLRIRHREDREPDHRHRHADVPAPA